MPDILLSPPRARTFPLRAALGLAAALLLPLLPLGKWIAPGDSTAALLLREAVWWVYAAACLAWLRCAERLPFASIGLRRPTWRSLPRALAAALLLIAAFALHSGLVIPALHLDPAPAAAARALILARPFWFRLLMVLRAAVVEEILFRGYMIEKIRQLGGGAPLAVLVPVAAFAAAHLSGWGLAQLIPVGCSGLVLALLYVWKRDLPANMLAHFLTDGAGFLLG